MDTTIDRGSPTLSLEERERTLALVSGLISSLETWAAMRGASQELRDTIAPPPMSRNLQLAAAHVSGLQGHLSVCDLGPVLLVCGHCDRRPDKKCLQHILRVQQEPAPDPVFFLNTWFRQGQTFQKVYIGAVCCATQAAPSLREQDWEDLKQRVY
jgi:hypothetical protein